MIKAAMYGRFIDPKPIVQERQWMLCGIRRPAWLNGWISQLGFDFGREFGSSCRADSSLRPDP